MLGVISIYSSWFSQKDPSTIMTATLYVLNSLNVTSVSLQAANALRELCDNNRTVLAQNSLSWFADLYGKLDTIPDAEKEKVLQSITSVIQALPVEQAVEPATLYLRWSRSYQKHCLLRHNFRRKLGLSVSTNCVGLPHVEKALPTATTS